VQLTSAIRIGRPAREVLDALLDAGLVAACLPGSRLIGEVAEGTYAGELQLRIGPVDAVYAGTVHLDAADRAAGTATLHASGQERSGQGSAVADVRLRVESAGTTARVLISADLMLRGAVAEYAPGAIGDVGQRLVEEFAGNVEQLLVAQAADAPLPPGLASAAPDAPGARQAATWTFAGKGPPDAKRAVAAAAVLLAAGAVTAGALAALAAWRRRRALTQDLNFPPVFLA
jgi:uncharacterized protein